MSNIKNPTNFWGGAIVVTIGAILVYFGVDYSDTNLQTFVYPQLIAATLIILGWVGIGVGIIMMLLGYFKARP